MPLDKQIGIRAPEDLVEKVKLLAKRDRRSLSNYILRLIEDDLRAAGMLDAQSSADEFHLTDEGDSSYGDKKSAKESDKD